MTVQFTCVGETGPKGLNV